MKKTLLAMALSSLLLAACGGGGDSGSEKPNNPIPPSNPTVQSKDCGGEICLGRFVDSNVQGVDVYQDGEFIATTDANGEFPYYPEKGQLEFKIGKLVLGQAKPDAIITPENLFADNKGKQIQVLQILQTLDDDNNPENGITISAEAIKKAQELPKELNIAEAKVTPVVIVQNINITVKIVPEAQALAHFEQTKEKLEREKAENTELSQKIDRLVGYWEGECDSNPYSSYKEIMQIVKLSDTKIGYIGVSKEYKGINCLEQNRANEYDMYGGDSGITLDNRVIKAADDRLMSVIKVQDLIDKTNMKIYDDNNHFEIKAIDGGETLIYKRVSENEMPDYSHLIFDDLIVNVNETDPVDDTLLKDVISTGFDFEKSLITEQKILILGETKNGQTIAIRKPNYNNRSYNGRLEYGYFDGQNYIPFFTSTGARINNNSGIEKPLYSVYNISSYIKEQLQNPYDYVAIVNGKYKFIKEQK